MSELLRKTGLTLATATFLAGCTSEASPRAEVPPTVATNTPEATSQSSSEITTVQDDPAIEAVIGNPISAESKDLGDGLSRLTVVETNNGYELDGSDIGLATFKCHPARELTISPLQTDEIGLFYSAACNRKGVQSNRPIVDIPTFNEREDYSSLTPGAVNEGWTVLAHPGNVVLEWNPAEDHTKMRVIGGSLFQIAQVTAEQNR